MFSIRNAVENHEAYGLALKISCVESLMHTTRGMCI